ncbi:protein kinase [Aspergillus carlsbadensis]|nr:protein kinase [Aspergillus carlsbadensis]
MLRLGRRLSQSFFIRPTRLARQISQSAVVLNPNAKLEEETLRWYGPDRFYPVRIGDVFRSRYQVLGKLGYGGYSTAWLCKDLQEHEYITLKVFERDSKHGERETKVYKHLQSIDSDHTGSILVRQALDDFQMTSADNASHQCLTKTLPGNLVKPMLIHILLALDFLHTEAGIVHTDIQTKNIMLHVEDESILTDFEEAEKSNPSPSKLSGDRVIYSSRTLGIPKIHGRPILADFGEARFISSLGGTWEDVQPFIYRASEVVLRVPWDHKIDIWNLAVLTWDLLEPGHLFYARDAYKNDSDSHHLAEIVAILGLPPQEILQSEYATQFFDDQGGWISATEIPNISLESLEANLQGEDQASFLRFIRKMLQWRPEDRASAKELLSDPWLRSA